MAATERSRERGGPKRIGGGGERVLGPPVGTRGSVVVLPAERAGGRTTGGDVALTRFLGVEIHANVSS
jgi:hypothetical protein